MARRWYDDEIKRRYIYALFDPRIGEENPSLHIGQTDNPKRRYRAQITHPTNPNLIRLMSVLKEAEMEPIMIFLESGDLAVYEAFQLELVWISVAMREGFQLLNGTGEMKSADRIYEGLKSKIDARSLPIDVLHKTVHFTRIPRKLILDGLLDNLDLALIRY